MSNIKISYTELETRITELRSMREEWSDHESKVKPSISGGGMTVTVADQVADTYVGLYHAVCSLLDNTILFLDNLNNSVKEADNAGAKSMTVNSAQR